MADRQRQPAQISIPGDTIFMSGMPAGAARGTAGTELMPNLNTPGFRTWINQCTANAPTVRSSFTVNLGESWAFGLIGYTMGSTLLPPNAPYPNCSAGGPNTLAAAGMFNMSSFHPGGATSCSATARCGSSRTAPPSP